MKKFNFKLGIEIFRNSTQKIMGDLRGSSKGFGCPKRHPDTLLAKTMPRSIPTDSDKNWGIEQTRYFRFLLNVEI